MTNLRKHYNHIVKEIEKTPMSEEELRQWEKMKAIMQTALKEVEEEIAEGVVEDMPK